MKMKKWLLISFFFLANLAIGQNEQHQSMVNGVMKNLNDGHFEQIYQALSPKMKQAKPRQTYFEVLGKVKSQFGKLKSLELQDLKEARNKTSTTYIGFFEHGELTVKIASNSNGEIIGLLFLEDSTSL